MSSDVIISEGDLFEASETYICHQCNCVTKKSAHLSREVFRRYPWADIYTSRKNGHIDTPGTIVIKGDGEKKRYVINLLGQYYPGKTKFPHSPKDGIAVRQRYFQRGIEAILQIPHIDLESIAFPWGIACGAAGGDWKIYLSFIEKFASQTEAFVKIYKKV